MRIILLSLVLSCFSDKKEIEVSIENKKAKEIKVYEYTNYIYIPNRFLLGLYNVLKYTKQVDVINSISKNKRNLWIKDSSPTEYQISLSVPEFRLGGNYRFWLNKKTHKIIRTHFSK